MLLKIAGFCIKIGFCKIQSIPEVKEYLKEQLEIYYRGFISRSRPQRIHHTIFIQDLKKFETVTAKQDTQRFYTYYYESRDRYTRTHYLITIFHFSLLLETIILELLAKNNGFILHASSVGFEKNAYTFLGRSGAGKSTIMKYLRSTFTPLGDDTIILRKEKESYFLYQTPFVERESWIPKGSQRYTIGKVYFLFKSEKNRVRPLKKAQAMSFLIPQLVTTAEYSHKHAENLQDFLNEHEIIDRLYFSIDPGKKKELEDCILG